MAMATDPMETSRTKTIDNTMEFRDLKRQYAILKDRIDAQIQQVLSAGTFIGGGPVSGLEGDLADYVGTRFCVSCANGTDALLLALRVWGIGPGHAVFVPDFTFFSTAEVVAALGATPVFVDCRADTFNMDVNDLERKIDAVRKDGKLEPKVVTCVDLFGQPADYKSIVPLARRHGMLVLEDGAQGFGGSIDGRMACSFADIATTSFFPAKPLGCYGDGGAIFTDNGEWAQLAQSLKVHGKGQYKYDNVRIGMNSRLDTLQAAVLTVKLAAFREQELELVNSAARLYDRLIPQCCAEQSRKCPVLPYVPAGYVSSWAQYTIRLDDRAQRDRVQAALKDNGIPTMVYYPRGMHQQTAFSDIKDRYGECTVTERLCDTVLSLPMHPYITAQEQQSVAGQLAAAL